MDLYDGILNATTKQQVFVVFNRSQSKATVSFSLLKLSEAFFLYAQCCPELCVWML